MFITHVIWVNLSQGRSTGGQHILSSNGSVMTSNQKGETAHVFFFFFFFLNNTNHETWLEVHSATMKSEKADSKEICLHLF